MAVEVILYPKETGGWMYDYYSDGWFEGAAPDGWGHHECKSTLVDQIKDRYPGIEINRGITGYCDECGEEYFDLETHCDCGQALSE